MDAQATAQLLRFFRELDDPRAANAWHPLGDILATAIMAVMCGCQGWVAVETWARGNQHWLRDILALPHGIPTHDTFNRVFGLIDPLKFEKCFQQFAAALVKSSGGLFLAVDGKTARRSYKNRWSNSAVHMVSAFVTKNQTVLGQLATDQKSNEITAIPKLLAMLELAGLTVTIDAMGCQRQIVWQINDQGGHWIVGLKGNQSTLHEKVKCLMDEAILCGAASANLGYFEQKQDKNNHGRIETRKVWVSNEVKWLGTQVLEQWPQLGSMIVVELTRQDLGDTTGHISVERRYFISDHTHRDAAFFAEGVRGHWGVENGLHWRLDVQMDEDQCRIRKNHGAENFSRLRRLALNKLKRADMLNERGKPMKIGLKLKQQACGWSREFLFKALSA
jgi:predicted transposase YbfD/YdcC